jgi:excisionase family DNA binding protein
VRTVQLWVEKGKLRAWKTVGGHRRILRQSVEEALQDRQREISPDAAVTTLRVLLVEDDPVMQTYYGALFEILNSDAELVFAADGFEGLVELGKISPQLMLVDIDMPNMDGITMLNRIRDRGLADDTRIAIVSALSEEDIAARGGVPEGTPVYSKPLSVDDLSALLRRGPNNERAWGDA